MLRTSLIVCNTSYYRERRLRTDGPARSLSDGTAGHPREFILPSMACRLTLATLG
jgi:hypothetical protein